MHFEDFHCEVTSGTLNCNANQKLNQAGGIPKKILPHVHHLQDNIHQSYLMALRDKKVILFILRAVVQSYLSALCVHSRLTNVLLRFNLDNKFWRGGRAESSVHEQTLKNQSRQLPESVLSSRSPAAPPLLFSKMVHLIFMV